MAKSRAQKRRAGRTTAPRAAASEASAGRGGFLPKVLDSTVIAIPLLQDLTREREAGGTRKVFDVIIDVNLEYRGGLEGARQQVKALIEKVVEALRKDPTRQRIHAHSAELQYVFASLDGDVIRELVRRDGHRGTAPAPRSGRAIYHIWPDFPLKPLIDKSISTVKADAAHNSFAAFGAGVVWAIVDSGIDGVHPHFRRHRNLDLDAPMQHRDFTSARGRRARRRLRPRDPRGRHRRRPDDEGRRAPSARPGGTATRMATPSTWRRPSTRSRGWRRAASC